MIIIILITGVDKLCAITRIADLILWYYQNRKSTKFWWFVL